MADAQARACVFLVPGDWATLTGGYAYDRRIVAGMQAAGWQVALRSPGDGFPWPDAAALAQAHEVVASLPDGALVVADGLAFGVLPELAEAHAARLRWVALVHHPLAFEAGLSPAQQAMLQASERRALACARQVIVTSASTARALAAYDVPSARIAVVEPGTDPAPLAVGGGAAPAALSLLCVATVTARKGHAVLLQALAGLRGRAWRLHCVGSLARDAAAVADAQQAVAQLGLEAHVVWHGEVDDATLQTLYAQADVFVLPSFHEGYGMALAEALAHGLPIVSCAAGAIVDTVPAQAGVLVPPGDAGALGAALQRLLDDPAHRATLAAGARATGAQLPDWPSAAARFAAVLDGVGLQAVVVSAAPAPSAAAAADGCAADRRPVAGFSTDWLTLREPFDAAARALAADALGWPALAARLQAGRQPTTVLDLGCGTGATLRALAPLLGARQRWRLVDHDDRLLAAVPGALAPWSRQHGLRLHDAGNLLVLQGDGRHIEVERCQADLVANFAGLPFSGAGLVTASALLDLVSVAWLATLVARCRAEGAAVCWALNVDDRVAWDAADPVDALVQARFSAHQRRDKGFGPAPGGAAAAQAGVLLQQAGYRVAQAASDWRIDGRRSAADRAMLRALVQGMGQAAIEQAPADAVAVQGWQARRDALVAGTRLRLGHIDLLGWPEPGAQQAMGIRSGQRPAAS